MAQSTHHVNGYTGPESTSRPDLTNRFVGGSYQAVQESAAQAEVNSWHNQYFGDSGVQSGVSTNVCYYRVLFAHLTAQSRRGLDSGNGNAM